MIRQAISCDICGAEKKQTNHWFVAWEQAGELRVSGWSSRNRLRAGSRHLCGQVCLHKLADEFMARVIAQKSAGRAETEAVEMETEKPVRMQAAAPCETKPRVTEPGIGASYRAYAHSNDTSLASAALEDEPESSAVLLAASQACPRITPSPIRIMDVPQAEIASRATGAPRLTAHDRRESAWDRERERAQRLDEHRPQIVARRSTGTSD